MDERQYRVIETLGEGGFGTVYRAELVSAGGFSKQVALKVLRADKDLHAEVTQRLRDEARILGHIRHRAIVGVDGLAHLDEGWAVVMEYIDGVDAKELLAAGPVPARCALEIVEEAASALHAAYHTKPLGAPGPLRLIHRDIKPANIRVTMSGEVKVLDFGVARADFASREAETRSMMYGTLAYMAPERLEGDDGPEADVFALGWVLIDLLLGDDRKHAVPLVPARYKVAIESRLQRLADIQAEHEPGITPDERAALEQLIRAMTSFNVEERPSAREVERQCRALKSAMPGEWLRDWAEDRVPALREARYGVRSDDASGRILRAHDDSVAWQREDGSATPRPSLDTPRPSRDTPRPSRETPRPSRDTPRPAAPPVEPTMALEAPLPPEAPQQQPAVEVEQAPQVVFEPEGTLQVEPLSPVETVQGEPVQAEPVQAEPVQAEPVQAEPVQAAPELEPESVQAAPELEPEPVQAEPVQAEPEAPAELASESQDPATELAEPPTQISDPDEAPPGAEPVQAEPVQAEPVQAEPVQAPSADEAPSEAVAQAVIAEAAEPAAELTEATEQASTAEATEATEVTEQASAAEATEATEATEQVAASEPTEQVTPVVAPVVAPVKPAAEARPAPSVAAPPAETPPVPSPPAAPRSRAPLIGVAVAIAVALFLVLRGGGDPAPADPPVVPVDGAPVEAAPAEAPAPADGAPVEPAPATPPTEGATAEAAPVEASPAEPAASSAPTATSLAPAVSGTPAVKAPPVKVAPRTDPAKARATAAPVVEEEPEPTPAPTTPTTAAAPPEPPTDGMVEFAGDAWEVRLVRKGKEYGSGRVPAGKYTIRAVFNGAAPVEAGSVTVEAGETSRVSCSASTQKCTAR